MDESIAEQSNRNQEKLISFPAEEGGDLVIPVF
jgi:hypothetical protein